MFSPFVAVVVVAEFSLGLAFVLFFVKVVFSIIYFNRCCFCRPTTVFVDLLFLLEGLLSVNV